MEQLTDPTDKHRPVGEKEVKSKGALDWLATNIFRLLISLFVPIVTFIGLYLGFIFLRDSAAPKGVTAIVAIIWGVGGVAALYLVSNWLVEKLNDEWRAKIQPFVFVGPAVAILFVYLLYPTIATFRLSLFDRNGEIFVGLQNYVDIFTNRSMFVAFRNNILLWIPFGALFTVVLGLLIAVLADRSKYERTAKALIFMPMAISMVGAAVIWNMIYDVNPNVGVLNWIYTNITGNNPQAWTASNQPWNNLFLIVVMIWLQTGFAMVLFSAAIKGIPSDITEAARVDGATEVQVFFRIMIPYISGTIITVTTTVVIFTLKIFDVVQVMTGGQFDTQVIATQFYREYFTSRNSGLATAIAIVLLITVIPVMIYNLKQFRETEAF
ncbi:MAG: sugar ABC transporter permease [Anaerolineae bacterium]|nr:sugar ABC transporter permease [Anaerolineae bacterium]MCB9132870.1 sugar ABC transporter permease [Anaerolineales bacterium]MCB0228572.1 sugar ABC transporter permease [Anaerolineae bacterium]MCB0235323.1 sugar ABC transporter permease [Anaerolineae bacterium]MCB0248961.1 sugar ABC transporter permease [Anaerolineae bacterium]